MRDVVKRVVLDVDTGIDDALALLYAVAHPELDLGAVTCVSGNVALRQVVRNTCFVLDLAQASAVPVGPGADATLVGQGPRLGHRHGANGLGDLPVQASGREPQPDTAVELLSDRLRHAEQPVTLLALAPQTNLAMLVPDHLEQIAGTVEKLIFVGGRLAKVDPAEPAEFNVGMTRRPPPSSSGQPGCRSTCTAWMSSIRWSYLRLRPCDWLSPTSRRFGLRASCCGHGVAG